MINSSVLCILNGTLLTVIVNPAKALDSDKLDGHDSTYFATAGDLSTLDNQVGAISTKVGTGVLDVGSNCVDGINTLNTHLQNKDTIVLLGEALTPLTNGANVDVSVSSVESYSQLLVVYGFAYGNSYQYRYYKIDDYQKVIGVFSLVRVNNTTIRITSDGATGVSGANDKVRIYGIRS